MDRRLHFACEEVRSRFIAPDGGDVEQVIEIRMNPITFRTSRITLARSHEAEKGTERLPEPPPDAGNGGDCPFCQPQVKMKTPRCRAALVPTGRSVRGESLLFPNLFPYGAYSAVSLFGDDHFVEIGRASVSSYRDSLLNCADYLRKIIEDDPRAVFMAITQNHLPSAGGSLLHPHLQVNADRIPSNHQRFLRERADAYFSSRGSRIFSDYLQLERRDGRRYIGSTGDWQWLAAFAPEGFYELWAIFPGRTSLEELGESDWEDLARGLIKAQKFYRSLCRNGYNFGLLLIEDGNESLELRAVVVVRSNHAPWVRNDHTGFEVMLGDMATFVPPEMTAQLARSFWVNA